MKQIIRSAYTTKIRHLRDATLRCANGSGRFVRKGKGFREKAKAEFGEESENVGL
ncbi:unnamed protein product [Sphenostylis stenocarpa]|uniref:Uncharacterized protein n=1 Tax=Sphenostylis stenocarpa TaxID=92480 RepID=A0AA86T2U6_9FABA|nr:unnamed protein product [Sphenostylis stenocarpa]